MSGRLRRIEELKGELLLEFLEELKFSILNFDLSFILVFLS
ncbi:MAG: hypothetical protein ACOX3T_05355 [Bdellovibrionota bacterium]